MAVRVASVSSVESLKVEHKGAQYVLMMQQDGAVHVPFAYAVSVTRQLKPLRKTVAPLPFLRVLRPNQIAPTMVMKLRLTTDGYALNAQGCADGKTTQAFWAASQLGVDKLLFVVHRTGLADQIVSEGRECTGMAVVRAEDPEALPADARVVVVMVHVMHRLPKAWLRDVDLLVVDECDRVAGPVHGTALLHCTPKRVLGMTATPGELNSRDVDPVVGLLYGLKPILPGIRKPFRVVRILYPFKPPVVNHWYVDTRTQQRKYGVDWKAVLDSISRHHQRNVDLVRLVRVLLATREDAKVFVLLKYKYNVKAVADILTHVGMVKNRDYALIYGDEDSKDVMCCRVYIGTYSKGEAGFDEKGLRGFDGRRVNHVVLGSDVTDPRQGIGRAFRYEGVPCVWEVLDDNDIIRGPHAGARERWYSENGVVSVRTLELNEVDLGPAIAAPVPPPYVAQASSGGRGGRSGGRGAWRGRGGGRGGRSGYAEPP